MSNSPIGLIGVGLLGTALAERMLVAGCRVLGFDREASRIQHLCQLGGVEVQNPGEIAQRCNPIVLCLPDSQIVAAVVSSIELALRPGTLLIDATTGDPDATAALAERLAAKGIGYVDATIAGSSDQVRRGEVVVICGGASADYQRAEAVLATWSEKRFQVGPAGSGARLKLVVNLVLGLNRAVLAEGLSLAAACGIEPATALEALKATPAYSTVMDTKGSRMLARDYLPPQARLAQHHKDVRLILDLAARHGAATPLSAAHKELLQQAIELGYAEADNSAILEAFRRGSSAP